MINGTVPWYRGDSSQCASVADLHHLDHHHGISRKCGALPRRSCPTLILFCVIDSRPCTVSLIKRFGYGSEKKRQSRPKAAPHVFSLSLTLHLYLCKYFNLITSISGSKFGNMNMY